MGNLTAKMVAARFLARKAAEIDHADELASAITFWLTVLRFHNDTMNDLIAAGNARRLGRIDGIRIRRVEVTGSRNHPSAIVADVQGTTSNYNTRITISPKRGHHCTCPDWEKNGARVGPCKHVLALGTYWLNERVLPAVSQVGSRLIPLVMDAEFK